MLDVNTGLTAISSATNVVTNITLAAPANQRWSIGGVAWSYDGTVTTTAGLNIWQTDTTATNILFQIDISANGMGSFRPAEPFKFPVDVAIVFELNAGGAGVTGKLNILGAKRV